MGHLSDFFPDTCTIQALGSGLTSEGEPNGTWAAIDGTHTDVPCTVSDGGGDENRQFDQVTTRNVKRIGLQGSYPNITPTHRVLMSGGTIYAILDVDQDQMGEYTVLVCEVIDE